MQPNRIMRYEKIHQCTNKNRKSIVEYNGTLLGIHLFSAKRDKLINKGTKKERIKE